MLTGRRTFEGEDVSLTLAAVMTSNPEFERLPSNMTPALEMGAGGTVRGRAMGRVSGPAGGARVVPPAPRGRTSCFGLPAERGRQCEHERSDHREAERQILVSAHS